MVRSSAEVFGEIALCYNSEMESIIRNVRDIETNQRRALEQVLGQKLQENQQIIIQVVTPVKEPEQRLPDWCNVYEGLTAERVTEIEDVILGRCDLTRPSG